MELDALLLARMQFAFTIMFHYLFPPMTIGLGGMLVYMEAMYLRTGDPVYEAMTKFWIKIFALNFAIGVASGIVMEFQFGTNWADYSRFVGDVFGSALAAEGIFAFFLESGFLAILVFGWDKVTPKVHFLSTVIVSLGSKFSAVWIIIANSWQHTPAGFHIVNDRAEITSFWEVVFNPSSMVRLTHVLFGSYVLAGFFVMSVTAYYILRNRHLIFAHRAFKIGLVTVALASVGQLLSGHWHAEVVAHYQPAKLAAFEGVFETREYTPLYLFGIPDAEQGRVRFGLPIPGMLSFLVHRDFRTPVTGLDQFPKEDRPPLMIPFQMYHLMISLGMLFLLLSFGGLFLWWRGLLFQMRWLLWVYVFAVILPYLANQAGWVATEVGRQPWVVYGYLRTADGISRSVSAGEVLASLIMFGFVYLMLLLLFLYVLDKKIRHGPDLPDEKDHPRDERSLLDIITRRGRTAHDMLDGEN